MGAREINVRKIMKAHHGWIKGRKEKCTQRRKPPTKLPTGITVHYFKDPSDQNYRKKVKACKEALKIVSRLFQLPTSMFIYCTTQPDSAGYVSTVSVKGTAVRDLNLKDGGYVFLGDTSIEHGYMKKGTEKLVRGGVIDHTKSKTLARLVADQVHDNHKGKKATDAMEARMVAACIHEIGHILHQMDWRSAYYDCLQLRASVVDGKVYEKASKNVSDYAYTETNRPPEFVAETFCGLMNGLRYPQNTIDLYNILDGPGESFSVDMKGMVTLK
jgi:hypothetical protein